MTPVPGPALEAQGGAPVVETDLPPSDTVVEEPSLPDEQDIVIERGHGPGSIFQLTLEAPADPVEKGDFGLYVPDGVTRLRGVIVHQHGCGRSGIDMPYDLHWQALANRWAMALMGTEFPTLFDDGDHCDRWSRIENGSEALFLRALAEFAQLSGHSELGEVPWALWGHSGGASWAYAITKKYPERTLVTVLKSICDAPAELDSSLLGVPLLLATGVNDLASCYPVTTDLFRVHRSAGAFWTLADEVEGSHDSAKLRLLAIPYLDAMIAARLPQMEQGALQELSNASAYLGDNATGATSAAASFAQDPAQASWLPDADIAKAWQEFITTRTVIDTTAPELPPEQLNAETREVGVRLSWQAEADLQSGIVAFHIYRDGLKVARVPEAGVFQGGNYGDEPEPVEPALTFLDESPGVGTHVYEVTTVNGSAMESGKSPSLSVVVE